MRQVIRCAVLAVSLGALVGACGGEDAVDRGELETQVQEKLTETVGQQAPEAVCPDDLKAEKGATTRCHMDFPEGKRLGITVKVSSVDGDTAKFDIAADEKLTNTPK